MADASKGLDAIIIGAGFSGLYMLHKLREKGLNARILEAADDVGGTWYWNRYPGARCDIPSLEYCYSFSPELQAEWQWTERYAAQPEILRYLEHVADRFDLRRDISFQTRVTAAHWDEASQHWQIETDGGSRYDVPYCIMATGNLSVAKMPDIPGIEDFAGALHHTADWPRGGVDFAGKRVGVIGTGSSGIQAVPVIAEAAAEVIVYQRTPSFAVPASNRPLTPDDITAIRADYDRLREEARSSFLGFFGGPMPGAAIDQSAEEREKRFEQAWGAGTTGLLQAYEDLLVNEASNATAADFARRKIQQLVKDPETARRMTPTDYPIGARRLCSEIGYFEAMNRDNVALVDIRETPIDRIEPDGVVVAGTKQPLDMLVLATGFHAMTGALTRIDVTGADGLRLQDQWADGPRSYLGLMVAGFPNMFMVTGPGSPSVLSNMVLSIEQHVDWIADCISTLTTQGARRIEPTQEAETAWMDHVDAVAQTTLFPKANTWYQGRTRDGRSVFMPYVGGVGPYRDTCAEIAANGYRGFAIAS
ncbi:MAG: flavin-containing monooxygenase [Chakrabartia sp.]